MGAEAPTALPPIAELNALDRRGFEAALRLLFENASALLTFLYAGRPYRSYEEVLARAGGWLEMLPEELGVETLKAHPRIGASGGLSALSAAEQGAAPDERVARELAELNDAYEKRFRFRFVVFVAGRPKEDLIPVIRARMRHTRDEELRAGLSEFVEIAADRLRKLG